MDESPVAGSQYDTGKGPTKASTAALTTHDVDMLEGSMPSTNDTGEAEAEEELQSPNTSTTYGVDMLEGNDGPLVMEVNSSPGLQGIETATRLDVAGAIVDFIADQAGFPDIDVRQRLAVSTGYGVAEIAVLAGSDMAGRTIGESGLREKDIQVLTLHRGTRVVPNPVPAKELE